MLGIRDESVAVHVTVVEPSGKLVPLGGLLAIPTGGIPPDAVAVPRAAAETTAEHTFGSVLTPISGGAVKVSGELLIVTVITMPFHVKLYTPGLKNARKGCMKGTQPIVASHCTETGGSTNFEVLAIIVPLTGPSYEE